jgi:hypothetical protein
MVWRSADEIPNVHSRRRAKAHHRRGLTRDRAHRTHDIAQTTDEATWIRRHGPSCGPSYRPQRRYRRTRARNGSPVHDGRSAGGGPQGRTRSTQHARTSATSGRRRRHGEPCGDGCVIDIAAGLRSRVRAGARSPLTSLATSAPRSAGTSLIPSKCHRSSGVMRGIYGRREAWNPSAWLARS